MIIPYDPNEGLITITLKGRFWYHYLRDSVILRSL